MFSLDVFDAAAPPSVKELLRQARAKTGPVAWLLDGAQRAQGGAAYALLRGHPPLPPIDVGWIVGIVMVEQNAKSLADVMEWESSREVAPHALDAVACALRSGVVGEPALWKALERVVKLASTLPDSLAKELSVGLCADSAVSRGAALGLAQRSPAVAQRELLVRHRSATGTAAKRLRDALSALGGEVAAVPEEPARAVDSRLPQLLAVWATTFDERLIPAIAEAGELEAKGREPLRASSKTELEAVWLAVAAKKDPADVPRLLGTPWPAAWKPALARVQALEHFPADPRLAAGVKEHAKQYTSFAGRVVSSTASRLASVMHRAKKADAPEHWLQVRTPRVDVDAAWKAVWDAPLDRSRRAVLADALQQAGDPRGEFISLQLSTAEGAAEKATALLKTHVDAWTGTCPGLHRSEREFRDGFLWHARLKLEARGLENVIADAQSWKEGRTVEWLELDDVWTAEERVEPLLARMSSVRTLFFDHYAPDRFLDGLKGSYPAITALGNDQWLPQARPRAFPSLQMLCWHGDDVRLPMRAATRSGIPAVLLWHVDLPKALEAAASSTLEDVRLVGGGWSLRLLRSSPELAEVQATGRFVPAALEELVRQLAAVGRTTVRLSAPAKVRAKLPAGLAAVELVDRPLWLAVR